MRIIINTTKRLRQRRGHIRYGERTMCGRALAALRVIMDADMPDDQVERIILDHEATPCRKCWEALARRMHAINLRRIWRQKANER